VRAVATAQRWITAIYRLDLDLSAAEYVVHPEIARALLPEGAPRSGVVVVEEEGAVSLGLYVDPRDEGDPGTVIEETSHLLYLAWAARRDLEVSHLHLELQGEVDRYAVARIGGRDALAHFEAFEWCDWMDAKTRDMYVTAHRSAQRYCRGLEDRYPRRADTPALLSELRRFYRAAPHRKLLAA
jgi:hypothetical protein